jgi:7,8-dihydropterin-6-yl-methyl-4-(beta-D-ribofuranosyl)aminobenzene 5'-phosphate synthase
MSITCDCAIGKEVGMSLELNRRDFLKTSAASAAVMMAGDLLTGRNAGAQGTAKIPEVEKVVVTVLADNYYDTLRPGTEFAKRIYIGPGQSIHAEHGLAYYIETVINGKSHAFMFDYGIDFRGVSNNMGALNVDLKSVEAFGLSHGHWDHWGNLIGFLGIQKARLQEGIPLYVGEEAFDHRFAKRPGGLADIGQLRREEIEKLGLVKIVEVGDPTPIVPGAYLTGNIARITDYEKVPQTMLIQRGDKLGQDIFVGEQGLVFNVKGKGLVVISSCAHAGIVNTTKQAQKVAGIEKVHAIIGGFHLIGTKPEIIQRTVADIKAIHPQLIVPMHCTGFETMALFAREMPDQFFLNTVGTQYTFGA